MNIFVLDYNPIKASQYQCDKHVVKMSLETAQILCAAFEPGTAPYKRTHYNHPCTVWSRESRENYLWLVEHGLALCDEYTYRYNKVHKSKKVITWCQSNIGQLKFRKNNKTRFVLCFDEKFKVGNAVESYRAYYKEEKLGIAQWEKRRGRPDWV